VVLGSNTAAGSGTLNLANGTTLAATTSSTITLSNHVHILGSSATFGTSSASGKLVFSGSSEFYTSGTTTLTSGGAQVQFGNLVTNDASSQLVFLGGSAFILGGSVDESISSIAAGSGSTQGVVLFANSNAVHTGTLAVLGGALGSYVGVIDSAFATNTVHLARLLSKITASTFAGSLGFDSPTSTTLSYIGGTSNALNLSAFTGSSFEGIATTTSAILANSMVITPPSGGTLKFSALKGGILRVQAPLSSSNSVSQVGVNQNSNDSSTGAVVLENSSSNYSGGTTLQAGYLLFGANSTASGSAVTSGPLGTGSLTISPERTAYLAATSSSLTLHNPINVGNSGSLKIGLSGTTPSTVSSAGNNTFELAGVISGSGKVYVLNQNGTVTLSGSNTYTGGTDLASAAVVATNGSAFGGQSGALYFSGSSTLTVNASNLNIGDLNSAESTSSTIALGANTLSIYQNNAGTYRGTITGTGAVTKHNAGDITFANATTYTGGTTIHSGKVILQSGATLGASTSQITLNGGALIAQAGATVSNPLTLNSGSSIGGAGTFATAISVGSGVTLAPGSSPGTMTFSNGLTLASGGTLAFEIRDANTALTAGTSSSWDLLSISGVLAVEAASAAPFTIQIKSLNSDFNAGNAANFNAANSYAWTFATATSITGFEAVEFSIDRSTFSNTSAGQFFVSQSGNSLLLNFTPVPEPSTYVLMGTGLSLLAASALRRRKRSRQKTS